MQVALRLVERTVAQLGHVPAVDHRVADGLLAEPHHAAATDRGQRGVAQALHLEENAHVVGHRQALTVGQCEDLVVVQQTVQVLHPLRIDVAIEHHPVATLALAAQVVDHLAKHVREETVGPLARGLVQLAEQLVLRDGFGVDHVGVGRLPGEPLHGAHQRAPRRRLAAAARADQHHAVAERLNLEELQRLLHPRVAGHQMLLDAQLLDLLAQRTHLDRAHLGQREHVQQQRVQQRNVLGDQLRDHGLAHRLDHDALLAVLIERIVTAAAATGGGSGSRRVRIRGV
mmetsp:Transcript_3550/g.11021  ORF Transcript_3550/g.11021 Transcript_3550/m.11021 type:complete len:286 (+) Transcript_3550:6989-7846(+)